MQAEESQGYRIRPSSFAISVGFHCVAIVAVGLIPVYTDTAPNKPIYDEMIRPEEHKIVWYDFRKPLPDVDAAKRIGTFPKPRGRELSREAIIAKAPKAKSSKQFIWQPIPKLEIHRDGRASAGAEKRGAAEYRGASRPAAQHLRSGAERRFEARA
jgi:hypothetical protein